MRKATLYTLMVACILLLVAGCASIGNPSGGPRDEDPPRFVTSSPLQGAVDVTPTKAVLTFDELIQLKDAFNKVVVSPPGAQVPRVSSLGRRVTVEFRDSLLPNTTYTVDFGDAIVDNNEGNKLENFIYTFSTGPVLDSLMVSGMVLGAEDLVPAAGIYVGLHSNLNDSAFLKTRFDRIAKTDDNGKFVIGGLAPGQYRIFALDDRDGDLAWSSPEETMAFYDAIIEPYAEQTISIDSIFNLKTGEVDSVVNRSRSRFLPNNILLRSFNTGYAQQYITKYERIDSTRINLIFNAPADSMPVVEFIPSASGSSPVLHVDEIAVTERSISNDTISFWLKDRNIIAADTLRMAVRYLRSDSAYNMVPVNDTLRLLTQRPNIKAKKNDRNKEIKEQTDSTPLPPPTITINAINARPEVNQSLYLEFPQPLKAFDASMVQLQYKEDSVWYTVPDFDTGKLSFDTLNPRKLTIAYPWEYQTTYKLVVDSLAGENIYGLFSDDLELEFTTRSETDYGTLIFNLSNYGDESASLFVQLLDAQGKPIRKEFLENGSVSFEYLLPGKYNARVIIDHNGNGKWDPGNFEKAVPPDVSYYYPETVDLKANWDQEIDWNVFTKAVDKQLPETLRKKK